MHANQWRRKLLILACTMQRNRHWKGCPYQAEKRLSIVTTSGRLSPLYNQSNMEARDLASIRSGLASERLIPDMVI
jgi:hypothetical protein